MTTTAAQPPALVDLWDLPDWALSLLARAGCRTAADAARLAGSGRYDYVADGVGRTDGTLRLATLLWDLSCFGRPYPECHAAAGVVRAAAEGGAA